MTARDKEQRKDKDCDFPRRRRRRREIDKTIRNSDGDTIMDVILSSHHPIPSTPTANDVIRLVMQLIHNNEKLVHPPPLLIPWSIESGISFLLPVIRRTIPNGIITSFAVVD